ncbi:PEP-CTERM sorting domain-containing protein [Cellvibrio sp. UBA7661]|uniref:PEP-CTERM sorting domain-containing protein n=1 Tax=Cellvibrio sp. UBA7661 TaxID=1946311 RepID=UPI002F350C3C
MIKSFKRFLVAVVCVFSANSFAGLITDVESFGAGQYVGSKQTFSWTHNILDQGFVLGSAESASILIEFRDDDLKKSDGPENAHIFFDLTKITGADVKPVTSWFHDFSFSSLVELNADGLLVVTVKSVVGDFYIDSSTLNVVTKDAVAPAVTVSEPNVLLLLGFGLLGLGLVRRKRQA